MVQLQTQELEVYLKVRHCESETHGMNNFGFKPLIAHLNILFIMWMRI